MPPKNPLLLCVVAFALSIASAIDVSNCPTQIANYPCHIGREGCMEERLGKISNTLPLARGYDLAISSNLYFTRKPFVFQLSYCDDARSNISHVFERYRLACEQQYDVYTPKESLENAVRVYTSVSSYSTDAAIAVGVSVDEAGLAFQGAYSGIAADLRERRGAVAITEKTVQTGSVRLEGLECLSFTPNYARCFNELNETDPSHPSYTTLFREFGTHVIVQLGIGAKQFVSSSIDQCERESYKEDAAGIRLRLIGIVSFALGTTSVRSSADTLDISEVSFDLLGGKGSLYRDNQWKQFVQSVKGREAVIGFEKLVPLYSLVNTINDVDDERDQDTLQQTFKKATEMYMERQAITPPDAVDCDTI